MVSVTWPDLRMYSPVASSPWRKRMQFSPQGTGVDPLSRLVISEGSATNADGSRFTSGLRALAEILGVEESEADVPEIM
jgi:hypothetical protein